MIGCGSPLRTDRCGSSRGALSSDHPDLHQCPRRVRTLKALHYTVRVSTSWLTHTIRRSNSLASQSSLAIVLPSAQADKLNDIHIIQGCAAPALAGRSAARVAHHAALIRHSNAPSNQLEAAGA